MKQQKGALKSGSSYVNVNISKLEAKVVIKGQVKKTWLNEWSKDNRGRSH